MTFGAGLPSGVVAVQGDGAPPHVALVSPAGVRIAGHAGRQHPRRATSLVFHNPQTNTTYFVLKAPRGGDVEDRAGGRFGADHRRAEPPTG